MAEPPEEQPGGLFEEPPHEPLREHFGRHQEPPQEPADEPREESPHESYGGYRESHDEPPQEPTHAPYGGHDEPTQEPTHAPYGGHDEPPEPTHAPYGGHDEPPEPSHAPYGGHDEPPEESTHDRFGQSPPGDDGRQRDHPTGELFDEPHDHPTGEFVDEHGEEDDDDSPTARRPVAPGDLLGDLGEEIHSPAQLHQRRAEERAQRRRAGRRRLFALIGGLAVVIVIIVLLTSGGSSPTTSTTSSGGNPLAAAGTGAGHLAAGSSTSALTANILVADRNNDRVLSISPQGRIVWSVRLTGPSDAFLSPTARSITVTQPGAFVVLQLAVADRKAFYRYGHSGVPGSADDRLHDPETAQELSDGKLVIADKANCRILYISPPSTRPSSELGTPGSCVHDPPKSLAYPDSVFPALSGGGIVVTELDPGWVDVLSATNSVLSKVQPSDLSAPDDANEYAPGKLIATSHTHPGEIEEFETNGKVLWRYDFTSGDGELDRPSLAEVLPDGDVLVCDSGNDRIVVIDPQTDTIIWQYGHTGKPGAKPGYLHTPDSAVLVP
jgi:DNA-binding beta-propeller fold protein YncE